MIIKQVCSSQNNFCLGEHAFRSKYNGIDADSAGDYDLLVRVNEMK